MNTSFFDDRDYVFTVITPTSDVNHMALTSLQNQETDMGVASRKPEVGSSWKSSTLLVINERIIRKIAEYSSYMSAFLANCS